MEATSVLVVLVESSIKRGQICGKKCMPTVSAEGVYMRQVMRARHSPAGASTVRQATGAVVVLRGTALGGMGQRAFPGGDGPSLQVAGCARARIVTPAKCAHRLRAGLAAASGCEPGWQSRQASGGPGANAVSQPHRRQGCQPLTVSPRL
jgi:hypothetical protein